MIRIPLRRRDGSVRAYALIDDCDAHLAEFRWSRTGGGYVTRDRGRVYLHREVMQLSPGDGLEVDHRNRDPLDCRRANLRVVTHAQNNQNAPARGGSRFRGVSWDRRGKWRAQLYEDGVKRLVGLFDDELDAARAVEARRRVAMPFALPDPELEQALVVA